MVAIITLLGRVLLDVFRVTVILVLGVSTAFCTVLITSTVLPRDKSVLMAALLFLPGFVLGGVVGVASYRSWPSYLANRRLTSSESLQSK